MCSLDKSMVSNDYIAKKAKELALQQDLLEKIKATPEDMCSHLLDVYDNKNGALTLVSIISDIIKSEANCEFWDEVFNLLINGSQTAWNNEMMMDDLEDIIPFNII